MQGARIANGLRSIALCMIVRDEAHILERCLKAARPLLDHALIVDTGSTDATVEVARQALRDLDLPGLVVEHPWRDFAYNRSWALSALRKQGDIDYALMIDADDRLELADDFDVSAFKAALSADVYSIATRMADIRYLRPQLISNRKPFRFRGVLHEFLDCEVEFSQATAEKLHVVSVQDSARNRDPDKFRRDAETIALALRSETDGFLRTRYTFYLAQSCRDCGEAEASIEAYLRRVDMGGWDQEVYCALLYAARQMEQLGRDPPAVLDLYLRAAEIRPDRVEALHDAARLCRRSRQFARGAEIAERGLGLSPPDAALFVETSIYAYGLDDEFAVNAYWADRPRASLEAGLRLLGRDDLPEGYRERVLANARFALDKLSPPG
ncbi:MAG: glycosyltransferase [Caulobacteraceae bacterium]